MRTEFIIASLLKNGARFSALVDQFAMDEWQPTDDGKMISPGGRTLTMPVFNRMRAAAEAREAGRLPQQAAPPELQSPQATNQTASPSDADSPDKRLAAAIQQHLNSGKSLTAKELWQLADTAFGGTRAQGSYGPSHAYDAMEAGTNLALLHRTNPKPDAPQAKATIANIGQAVANLPTQTNRSGNKDLLQQFSTPPHYAFLATWLANLNPNDIVLEPSAGTGSIAVHALNSGATVWGNELDPRRAELLKQLLGGNVTSENAEQIAGILPAKGVPTPTAIVMNPPFSSTGGRTNKKDILTGAKHISEALQLLAPGGRLVAIVGEGMRPDAPGYRRWFDRIRSEYSLRANVGVSGDEYAKSGTNFGTRLLIIDKTGPTSAQTITGDSATIAGVVDILAGVRNDRPQADQPASGLGAGSATAEPGGSPSAPGQTVSGATAPGSGSRRGTRRTGGGLADSGTATGGLDAVAGSAGVGTGTGQGTRRGVVGSAKTSRNAGTVDGGNSQSGGAPDDATLPGQSGSGLPRLRPAESIKLTPQQVEEDAAGGQATTQSDLGDAIFVPYKAAVKVPGAQPHPAILNESAAMAAVRPPVATYQPKLSPDLIDQGILSEPALESVIYAGQSHSQMLEPDDKGVSYRRGYFIGDGTGAGKGRQIAGIITDNVNQGRSKHVWVSLKPTLLEDARRDWRDLGNDPAGVVAFDKLKKAQPDKGVAFITYDTLKGRPTDKAAKSNIQELVDWLGGPDFDGVIAFDEAHAMANAISTNDGRGAKDPSARAMSGIELQKLLPNARVVYVSATGATEVSNLAYTDRLGLWGRGAEFADKRHFISEMQKGGVAAMEAVAQSLKAQGSYSARSLAFDDGTPNGKVTYDRVTHDMTPDQVGMYDTMADGWQVVLQNIDKALELTGGSGDRHARASAKSQFWGAHQRFFNQVMTAMQTPSVIRGIEKDIQDGRAPVVQLVNTMEAATKRAMSKRDPEADLEGLDVSPAEILGQYLDKSFPTERYETYTDDNGNLQTRPVLDSNGNPVLDPDAVRLREQMLDRLGQMRAVVPESPIDQIVTHFGPDKVAEVTGRKTRLVYRTQPDGSVKRVPESRGSNSNIAEAAAFQGGRKPILIFSDAGGTGRSYHSDKKAKNQAQRVHYMLQPGWRADNAVQGLGRTHRTNQASAPQYRLVEIAQLPGQKRFISTIARRLDQLGALTKGQSKTGSSGLFKAADNLESREAEHALELFFGDLKAGRIEGLDYKSTMVGLGFDQPDDPDNPRRSRKKMQDIPPMSQFLNRMLSLRVGSQAKVFTAFEERLQQVVAAAERDGTLNQGVENFKAKEVHPISESVIFRHPSTGAEVRLMKTKTVNDRPLTPFTATLSTSKPPLRYVQNVRSGKVRAVYEWQPKRNYVTGEQEEQVNLTGPTGFTFVAPGEINDGSKWKTIDGGTAQVLWNEEYTKAPKTIESEANFVTGALLPVWNRIPGNDRPRIYRVKPTGQRATVGRFVSEDQVGKMLEAFGMIGEQKQYDPDLVHVQLVTGESKGAKLSNGWKLVPARVQGENRIELVGLGLNDMSQVESDGAIRERINWATRYFIPTGPNGAQVLRRIMGSNRSITQVQKSDDFSEGHSMRIDEFFDPANYTRTQTGNYKSKGGRVLSEAQFNAAVQRNKTSQSKPSTPSQFPEGIQSGQTFTPTQGKRSGQQLEVVKPAGPAAALVRSVAGQAGQKPSRPFIFPVHRIKEALDQVKSGNPAPLATQAIVTASQAGMKIPDSEFKAAIELGDGAPVMKSFAGAVKSGKLIQFAKWLGGLGSRAKSAVAGLWGFAKKALGGLSQVGGLTGGAYAGMLAGTAMGGPLGGMIGTAIGGGVGGRLGKWLSNPEEGQVVKPAVFGTLGLLGVFAASAAAIAAPMVIPSVLPGIAKLLTAAMPPLLHDLGLAESAQIMARGAMSLGVTAFGLWKMKDFVNSYVPKYIVPQEGRQVNEARAAIAGDLERMRQARTYSTMSEGIDEFFDPANYTRLQTGSYKSKGGRVLSQSQYAAAMQRHKTKAKSPAKPASAAPAPKSATSAKKPAQPAKAKPTRATPAPVVAKPNETVVVKGAAPTPNALVPFPAQAAAWHRAKARKAIEAASATGGNADVAADFKAARKYEAIDLKKKTQENMTRYRVKPPAAPAKKKADKPAGMTYAAVDGAPTPKEVAQNPEKALQYHLDKAKEMKSLSRVGAQYHDRERAHLASAAAYQDIIALTQLSRPVAESTPRPGTALGKAKQIAGKTARGVNTVDKSLGNAAAWMLRKIGQGGTTFAKSAMMRGIGSLFNLDRVARATRIGSLGFSNITGGELRHTIGQTLTRQSEKWKSITKSLDERGLTKGLLTAGQKLTGYFNSQYRNNINKFGRPAALAIEFAVLAIDRVVRKLLMPAAGAIVGGAIGSTLGFPITGLAIGTAIGGSTITVAANMANQIRKTVKGTATSQTAGQGVRLARQAIEYIPNRILYGKKPESLVRQRKAAGAILEGSHQSGVSALPHIAKKIAKKYKKKKQSAPIETQNVLGINRFKRDRVVVHAERFAEPAQVREFLDALRSQIVGLYALDGHRVDPPTDQELMPFVVAALNEVAPQALAA